MIVIPAIIKLSADIGFIPVATKGNPRCEGKSELHPIRIRRAIRRTVIPIASTTVLILFCGGKKICSSASIGGFIKDIY
jgi:hypothetical protein